MRINKMATQQIKTISMVALLSLLSIMGGYKLNDVTSGNVVLYVCESRDIQPMECDSFSQYVHPMGKCINAELGTKICKTGWVKLVPEVPVYVDETDDLTIGYKDNNIKNKEWLCSVNGECIEKDGNS